MHFRPSGEILTLCKKVAGDSLQSSSHFIDIFGADDS